MTGHTLSLHTALGLWTEFFHHTETPLSLAVFRIVFGIILFVESLDLLRWGSDLFGKHGIQTVSCMPGRYDTAVSSTFRLHTAACIALALGFMTRISAALVFLNFCFRMKRNWLVIQGGDNIAKFMSLLLVFSNAGGLLSLDHLLGWRYLGGVPEPASQWPMRLMQIQVSVIYLRTVFWKLQASQWLDGSAVFHAVNRNLHLRGFASRMGVQSSLAYAPLAALLTWFTLAAEIFIGIFIWFDETRYAALAVAVVAHLGYEAFFSIKQFQWLMLAGLLLFVTPQEWLSLRAALQAAWH